MSRARTVGIGSLVALVVVALVLGATGTTLARSSIPDADGEVTLGGLGADVTVLRDERGVPHIYGDSMTDIARGQGYVHAQDRFFEMDLRRRITAGRLAELVGQPGVETDRVIRVLGWRRVAEQELPLLAPETRRYLQAYADGVNAYIRGRSPERLSLEYRLLGVRSTLPEIEQWTPIDSLAWLKAMAWDLKGNYSDELARARLSNRMPRAQIDQLYPPYDSVRHAPILSGSDWSPPDTSRGTRSVATPPTSATSATSAAPGQRPTLTQALSAADTARLSDPDAVDVYAQVQRLLESVPALVGTGEGIGSNSWVVSSRKSATGKPLLANDPHLAPSIPGIWTQNSLHCRRASPQCPLQVSGFSFAGLPGVVIGHNDKIAWGFTNLGPDVTDFFLEQVDNQGRYLRDDEWVPLETRRETIKVNGGRDETITVRSSAHGPILSDIISAFDDAGGRAPIDEGAGSRPGGGGAQTYAVSMAWTGLVPSRTADFLIGVNTAQNFDDFRTAARTFAAPAQNLVYADRDGTIGYQAPGLVPQRRAALPGTAPGYWPAPGWDSTYDWDGWVPFDQMPWAKNPSEGFIVAANQQVTASATPFLTTEWDHGYRSQRIRELLMSSDKVSVADVQQMQLDDRDSFAANLVPVLLSVPLRDDEFTREAQDLLRGWDGSMPASGEGSAAAAYYNAVWAQLLRLTFDDEVPADLAADGGSRDRAAVGQLLGQENAGWWDNKQTPNVTEGRGEILRRALVEARLDLTRRLGKDPSSWEWGKLHRLTLRHKALGGDAAPSYTQWAFNKAGIELPGGSSIVNANGWNAGTGFDVDWAPSMRMVVDLGDLDASTWVNQTGVSGHAFSDHYDDQVDAWASGEQFPWPFSEQAVRAAAQDVLTLKPQQ